MKSGVPCFTDVHPFYETRYTPAVLNFAPDERRLWGKLALYLVSMHYFWYLRRFIDPPGAILDVACGSGTRYLARKGTVAGLDISIRALKTLRDANLYGETVQASAFNVPFPDSSFDYVVAKFFFEHVPLESKPALLAEFHRLLKPRGRLIMLFDCDCTNPLWRWSQKDPERFRRAFVENDGHYGLIRPSQALSLLQQAGFHTMAHRAMNKTLLVHLPMLAWLQAYRGKNWAVDWAVTGAAMVTSRRLLNFAYTFAVTLWDDLVERFLPLDRARYILVACAKEG